MPPTIDLLKSVKQFIAKLIGLFHGNKATYNRPIIIKEYSSSFCRLLLVGNNEQKAVATWRVILKYAPYDLLFTCQSLEEILVSSGRKNNILRMDANLRKLLLPVGKTFHPTATHQIVLSRIGRYSVHNKVKIEILGIWRVDFVGMAGLASAAGDRYAVLIMKSLAKELLNTRYDEIKWSQRINHHARSYIGSHHNAAGFFEPNH